MNKFLNWKVLLAFAVATMVLVIISFFSQELSPNPKVILSTPISGSKSVNYYDSITLVFDQPVDPSLITVSSTPEEDWSIKAINNKSVNLNHDKYFYVDKDYLVNISYNNNHIYSLEFRTIHQQNDPRYTQEVVNEIERDYPLAAIAPHITNAYSVAYISPLTFEITKKNNVFTNEEIISQVESWVAQNGIDPSTHKYKVVNPTPNASPNL